MICGDFYCASCLRAAFLRHSHIIQQHSRSELSTSSAPIGQRQFSVFTRRSLIISAECVFILRSSLTAEHIKRRPSGSQHIMYNMVSVRNNGRRHTGESFWPNACNWPVRAVVARHKNADAASLYYTGDR
jgi:hypothetical protein